MSDILNKSLWRIYLFVILISLLILAMGSYFIWKTILNEARSELINENKMITSSMHSLLLKNEELFKIYGRQLLKLGLFTNVEQPQQLMDDLQESNLELAEINVINPQGDLIFETLNTPSIDLQNSGIKAKTSAFFNKPLKSNALVLGDTYFHEKLNQWVAPIQYGITNQQNKIVAVLSTAIKLKGEFSPWNYKKTQEDSVVTVINSRFNFQYISLQNNDELKIRYAQPINQDYLNMFSKHLNEQTGYTLQKFLTQGNNNVVTVTYPAPTGTKVLAALSFDNRYGLLTMVIKPISNLYNKLFVPLSWLFLLLLSFKFILYWLFRYLGKLQKHSKDSLEYQAQHDHLTGLPNLRYLSNKFDQWKNINGDSFAVLFIDLDDFKNSNDLYGHVVGDNILRAVASRIKGFFEDSLCIRQGGDEFIVVTPNTPEDKSEEICKQLLVHIKQPVLVDNLEFSVRASIGVARASVDGTELGGLLRKADIAMYEAKKHKGGFYLFSKTLDIENTRVSTIRNELNSALEKGEMRIVFQPQIDFKSNRILGAEALLRWNSQSLGEIPADEFIPIAESTGAIIDIGKFVFETALLEFYGMSQKLLKHKKYQYQECLRLSINVSVRQLCDVNFFDMLFSVINKYKCHNTKLMLEVTESLNVENIEELVFILEKIRLAGIETSLDDFGTGYSSLSYLSKLGINELKIDKSFVHDMLVKKQDKVLIKSIINLGRSLGISVLAEGVETLAQVKALSHYGCQYFQGYYFSNPLNIEELLEFFLRETSE